MVEPVVSHLQIVHLPLGIEDPYNPQPWERTPREPCAGEPVTVYVVTHPAGLVDALSLLVTVAGVPRFIQAQSVAWEGEGKRWRADLGTFDAGTRVAYQIRAHTTSGELHESAAFTFEVATWQTLTAVHRWQATEDGVVLSMLDEHKHALEVRLSIVATGEILVSMGGQAGEEREATAEPETACRSRQEGDYLILEGADTEVQIDLSSCALLARRGETLVSSSHEQPFLSWLGSDPACARSLRLSLALEEKEALYGTGERFDAFNRRGGRFDVRVYEQYKNQGARTYMPVPLVLSSQGYALFIEGTRPLAIDAGAALQNTLTLEAEIDRTGKAPLTARLFLAETPLEALQAYLCRTSLPTLPPEWVFGLWMSANDWNSQQRVMAEVERGEREGIPGDVVVIEAWADEATFYIWNDAQYTLLPTDRPPRLADFHFPPEGRWPDPLSMIEQLHRQGKRLILWQIPLLKRMDDEPHTQNSADAEAVIQHGWCARNADGSPYRNPGWWFPGALLPDFTSSEARKWWLDRRRYLVEEMGVDGFKTDGSEHIWGRDLLFADGRRGDEMINAFPVLYARTYHQLLRESGREDGVTFSRAGYAGSQCYPAHWAGDENSTWEAFRHSIIAGLSAGASGIPFWGWDIAGFSEEIPDGELYRRAWMMATFCPIMQYHSEYNARREPCRDRTPWNIAERTGDAEVLPVCRFYTALRRQLRPYILREAEHTALTGRPLMCALPLAYPTDPRATAYPYQYMFGRDLLVAPTVHPGLTTQEVYLPAGQWYDLWTHTPLEGAQALIVDVPANRIPVYVRARPVTPLAIAWEEITPHA